MSKDTQISAYISDATKERLDMFVRETGMKKGRVIEDALNAHLDALDEIPEWAIIPTRIVVSPEEYDRLAEQIETPAKPTPALRELMRGRDR